MTNDNRKKRSFLKQQIRIVDFSSRYFIFVFHCYVQSISYAFFFFSSYLFAIFITIDCRCFYLEFCLEIFIVFIIDHVKWFLHTFNVISSKQNILAKAYSIYRTNGYKFSDCLFQISTLTILLYLWSWSFFDEILVKRNYFVLFVIKNMSQ